jgi:hypothetical protein
MPFYVIGDVPSPIDFYLEGCEFFDIRRQEQTGLRTAALSPKRHYARKNLGYLLAIRAGSRVIVETDDDNIPTTAFWETGTRLRRTPYVRNAGWVNVYSYFSNATIWPRGLPLDSVRCAPPPFGSLPLVDADCPIQQGLADSDPDVDAVYRLLFPLPASFRGDRLVALGEGSWCPFNSQNTVWWYDAFPLMYLPAFCPFRMTDIWRSFVAQRIAWANGWAVLFQSPTVLQERNDHDLMRDFQDEVPGYLNNRRIAEALSALALRSGADHTAENLRICYESLIRLSVLEARELNLLEAWIEDLNGIRCPSWLIKDA